VLLTTSITGVALKAKLFRGFSDTSRLSILAVLSAGPLTVGEIVEATGLSQSNTSNHLACLRDCGLVAAEPQGRYVTYRLSDPRVLELLELAELLLADVARGVYQCTRYEESGAEGKEEG
jgi:DNA-binding transcriptional ArsR family regulator